MTTIASALNLTSKEIQLLDSIRDGMDQPGCGWLHELDPFNNDHVCAGVLGSLMQKGLVDSTRDDEGEQTCYWVTLRQG